TDRGQTWAQLDTLAGDIVMAVALSPNYATDGTLVAATYVGEAYLSQDGGDTWEPMHSQVIAPPPSQCRPPGYRAAPRFVPGPWI
ncbi:MAG: hypothetical protein AAGC54_02415, partial [Cyanobacteria bacterium P01_F01_bin.4]